MKKFVTALLVLTVFSTVILAGPMARQKTFGPGTNPGPMAPVAPRFVEPYKEQLKERIMLQDKEQIRERLKEQAKELSKEMFQAMNMTKEQAKQILQIVNEAKEKLNALQNQYKELKEKAGTMTLNEYRTAIQQLNQKRAQIIQEMRQKIGDIITVDQINTAWRQLYREKLRTRLQLNLNFLDDVVLEALEEYAK
ncbi:MAG: hypothetical protein ACK4E2_08945 [Pseudothermotoga sp.]